MLQLPYFTTGLVSAIGRKINAPPTIQNFMALPETNRRQVCASLSPNQYRMAMSVATQLPYLSITKPFFKVVGERAVTPGSLVQFVLKARFIPPGSKNVPEPSPSDLEDIDPEEGDVSAILGRSKSAPGKPGTKIQNQPVVPSLAHAPYFARDHSPRWHIFLADSRQGRIAVPPFTFTAFDKAITNDDGTPTFNVQTLKCQFQAPPQVGKFLFTYHVICDSYLGLDSQGQVTLDVVDPKDLVEREDDEEDEISEPEEGMLASLFPLNNTSSPVHP